MGVNEINKVVIGKIVYQLKQENQSYKDAQG